MPTPSTYAQVRDGRTKIAFVLDDAEKDMIQMQAKREGVTMTGIIRRALRYYCDVDIQQATVEK